MKNIELTCEQNDVRINKFLAENKISSRREADKLIESGCVKVNLISKKNDTFAIASTGMILSLGDKIRIKIEDNKYKYFVINKSLSDSNTALIPNILNAEQISPTLDLDANSDGLVLYSNDTILKNKIQDSNNLMYEYNVKVKEQAEIGILKKLLTDITYEGYHFKGAKSVRIIGGPVTKVYTTNINSKSKYTTINIILKEYKSNIIKKLMNAIHLNVAEVRRVRIGNLNINEFKVNTLTELSNEQIEEFKKCL